MSKADLPDSTQLKDLVESLKIYTEVKGLAKYVGEHILLVLNIVERQKIKEVIESLEKKIWKDKTGEIGRIYVG